MHPVIQEPYITPHVEQPEDIGIPVPGKQAPISAEEGDKHILENI